MTPAPPELRRVQLYNFDKPHRCPRCHAVAAPGFRWWRVYTCCRCSTRFARWPRLQWALSHVGLACYHCHQPEPVELDGEVVGWVLARAAGPVEYFQVWNIWPLPGEDDHNTWGGTWATRADAVERVLVAHLTLVNDLDESAELAMMVKGETVYSSETDSFEPSWGEGTLTVHPDSKTSRSLEWGWTESAHPAPKAEGGWRL